LGSERAGVGSNFLGKLHDFKDGILKMGRV
jgi:hypothetical protein